MHHKTCMAIKEDAFLCELPPGSSTARDSHLFQAVTDAKSTPVKVPTVGDSNSAHINSDAGACVTWAAEEFLGRSHENAILKRALGMGPDANRS